MTTTESAHSIPAARRTRSLVARVTIAVTILVAAFSAALLNSILVHQRMLGRVDELNQQILPVARDLDETAQLCAELLQLVAREDPDADAQSQVRDLVRALPVTSSIEDRLRSTSQRISSFDSIEPTTASATWTNVNAAVDSLLAEHRLNRNKIRDQVLSLERNQASPSHDPRRLLAEITAFEKRVRDLGDLVGTIAADTSQEIVDAQQNALLRSVALSLLALLVAIATAVIVRASLRPLADLSTAAVRLRQDMPTGKLAGTDRDDEVGHLARQFEAMALAVRDRDQELRDKNQALESALHALMEAQQARMTAERMAAVGELTSRITHELRNPLSSIGLNIEMLQEELQDADAPDDALQMVDTIDQSVQRLMRLTDEFLQMAAGVANFTMTDIAAVVSSTAELLRSECERAGVELVVDAEPAFTFGHADQLQQVIINLVQNAMQSIQAAGKEGRISVRLVDADTEVVLTVDDTGPGIQVSPPSRVFEAFVTGRAGGTGLGLSICQDIISAHRGQLIAHAHGPAGGARFEIRLPAPEV